MRSLLQALLSATLMVGAAACPAQGSYPTKPIHLVVPFVAGGTSDILARIIGQGLASELGQPVVVENRPGAGGNIGSKFVAEAAPDGYTLILASVGTHAINPSLYRNMPFDPVKDFTPVTLFATVPTVLVVNPKVKAKSARELIALAKAHPGRLSYASAGIGTTQHLAGEMFKHATGIGVVHIPYKGGAQAVSDLLGGQVAFMFPNIPVVYSQIKAGKLRALAVASEERSAALPDVPTMEEATGLKHFDVSTWFAILGPARMPPKVTIKLNRAINRLVDEGTIKGKLEQQGAMPLHSTPEQFGEYLSAEITKWATVVKQANVRVD
jgi:tripartite-type tricarboxylate transporter receptor subunit TctC